MNFLMHFHLAHADAGSGAVALGAMLPDLWRMAARPARARRDLATDEASLQPVFDGIAHHFEADAWFHRAAVFDDLERRTTEALSRADGGRSRRLALFAHVAAEMALDGALIRRDGPTLERAVHAAIAAHAGAAERAAELHHGESRRAAGVDPAFFSARMRRLLDAVASFELPGGYATGVGLATRLAGIRASFGMLADPSDLARWAEAFDALGPAADQALGELRWPGRG